MSYWDPAAVGPTPQGEEATPIMRPVKMELAPHARLGRRVNAMFTAFILLVFHTSMIVAGLLNWDVPCEFHLSRFLVIYGGCGLLFVYLLLREWLFYARLGSWPSTTAFLLMTIFYVCNIGSGVILAMYTFRARDTCRITAPLLYRWCFAGALFCAMLVGLCLIVPAVRCAARCVCAPIALCLISCVETVGMDVDVGLVGAGGAGGFGGDGGIGAIKAGRRAVEKQFIPAAAMLCASVLCAPVYLVYTIICAPVCKPCSTVLFKLFEFCGCVSILPDGTMEFRNCFNEATCGWVVRHTTQCLLAPGMTTPGRSIVGAFTNYAAMIWFWFYLLFEVYWNWGLMCESAVPDAADVSSPLKWFEVLSPSPVHWLILMFAVTGLLITLYKFIADMFTYPPPPPRSAYDVQKAKMRRQVRVCFNLILFLIFCTWGGFLFYFTQSQSECAASSPSIWRLALLMRMVVVVIVGLGLSLGCCVCVECCVNGRMRLVLLISDPVVTAHPTEAQPAIYSNGGGRAEGMGDPLLHGGPGTKFYVGAADDNPARLASEAPGLDTNTTLYVKGNPDQAV